MRGTTDILFFSVQEMIRTLQRNILSVVKKKVITAALSTQTHTHTHNVCVTQILPYKAFLQ